MRAISKQAFQLKAYRNSTRFQHVSQQRQLELKRTVRTEAHQEQPNMANGTTGVYSLTKEHAVAVKAKLGSVC